METKKYVSSDIETNKYEFNEKCRKEEPRNWGRDLVSIAPFISEGDLTQVYSSKTQKIPQVLNPEAFFVKREHAAKIIEDDMLLREGANLVPLPWISLGHPYIIVDIGHAHLPGVANRLVEIGIDCSFVIPGSIHDRFHEAIKYWAREYYWAKERLANPQGLATLIDTHRSDINNYRVFPHHFPDAKTLRELGIDKVLYFTESPVGMYPGSPRTCDLEEEFCDYQANGLSVTPFGIDMRQGFRRIDENEVLERYEPSLKNAKLKIGYKPIKIKLKHQNSSDVLEEDENE